MLWKEATSMTFKLGSNGRGLDTASGKRLGETIYFTDRAADHSNNGMGRAYERGKELRCEGLRVPQEHNPDTMTLCLVKDDDVLIEPKAINELLCSEWSKVESSTADQAVLDAVRYGSLQSLFHSS